MEGVILAMAVHLGRVYLPHPSGDNIFWETKIPLCESKGDYSLTCFYEKFSKCTIEDAITSTKYRSVDDFPNFYMGDFNNAFLQGADGLKEMFDRLVESFPFAFFGFCSFISCFCSFFYCIFHFSFYYRNLIKELML
jgi:hypothetical protein